MNVSTMPAYTRLTKQIQPEYYKTGLVQPYRVSADRSVRLTQRMQPRMRTYSSHSQSPSHSRLRELIRYRIAYTGIVRLFNGLEFEMHFMCARSCCRVLCTLCNRTVYAFKSQCLYIIFGNLFLPTTTTKHQPLWMLRTVCNIFMWNVRR